MKLLISKYLINCCKFAVLSLKGLFGPKCDLKCHAVNLDEYHASVNPRFVQDIILYRKWKEKGTLVEA